jgi:adenylosuccinate lyase
VKFGSFSALERVMSEAVKAGGDRQIFHEILRQISMQAWQQIQLGNENPLTDLVKGNEKIISLIPSEKLDELFQIEAYTGIAKERTLALAEQLHERLN